MRRTLLVCHATALIRHLNSRRPQLSSTPESMAGNAAGSRSPGSPAALACFDWTPDEVCAWMIQQLACNPNTTGFGLLPPLPLPMPETHEQQHPLSQAGTTALTDTMRAADLFRQQQMDGRALRGLARTVGHDGSRVLGWLSDLGVQPMGLRLSLADELMTLLHM